MRILLLSAYDTDSHKSWCQGLLKHLPEIDWTYLTLPGRYFSWRIRGNALSWAYGPNKAVLSMPYDLILATSMVDLATLRGLVPNLARTPAIMYFHENQFSYPKSQQQHKSIEPQMVNLFSALSAEHLVFNSQYNLDSFTQNARKLLKQLPDHAPLQAIDSILQKSNVLPVPIQPPKKEAMQISQASTNFDHQRPLKIIWNHRWEYDKGPDLLKEVIQQIERLDLPVSFTIAGMSFRNHPQAFKDIKNQSFSCVKHIATFEDKEDYFNALYDHHVVLSTALHEFQGLAMLEGAAHDCIPLAPNRLAYPEWMPMEYLYSESDQITLEANNIITQLQHWITNELPEKICVKKYYWPLLANQYKNLLLNIHNQSIKS